MMMMLLESLVRAVLQGFRKSLSHESVRQRASCLYKYYHLWQLPGVEVNIPKRCLLMRKINSSNQISIILDLLDSSSCLSSRYHIHGRSSTVSSTILYIAGRPLGFFLFPSRHCGLASNRTTSSLSSPSLVITQPPIISA